MISDNSMVELFYEKWHMLRIQWLFSNITAAQEKAT